MQSLNRSLLSMEFKNFCAYIERRTKEEVLYMPKFGISTYSIRTRIEEGEWTPEQAIAWIGSRGAEVTEIVPFVIDMAADPSLVDRCLRGDELRPRDAVRLLPSRDQCVSLWRALQHAVPPDGLETDYLPLLRRLSGALRGAEPFLRTVLCLEVFRERGLLQCCRLGDSISLHLTSQGKKVALDRSEYLLRLHRALDTSRGGGRL